MNRVLSRHTYRDRLAAMKYGTFLRLFLRPRAGAAFDEVMLDSGKEKVAENVGKTLLVDMKSDWQEPDKTFIAVELLLLIRKNIMADVKWAGANGYQGIVYTNVTGYSGQVLGQRAYQDFARMAADVLEQCQQEGSKKKCQRDYAPYHTYLDKDFLHMVVKEFPREHWVLRNP